MSKGLFIAGDSGRMGQELIKLIESNNELQLSGGWNRSGRRENENIQTDVVIDFSLPAMFPSLCEYIETKKYPLVSGTTGLNEDQFDKLKTLGNQVPVFWSANMSFGVYLMGQLSKQLSQYQKLYNLKIEETHHIHKKDKPSGTALLIESVIKDQLVAPIEIESFREGEVFGEHRLIAQSPNEKIMVSHEALNRSLFAQGAIDISLWLVNKNPGFYTMDDFFQELKS